MLLKEKFKIEHTGQGFEDKYHHKVHTDRNGFPCPVVAYLFKGYPQEQFVYQILNDTKGFLILSQGDKDSEDNKIRLWGSWSLEELDIYKGGFKTVKTVAQEVYKWKFGRECHFPPYYKRPITPEIFDPMLIEEYLHSPWMKGSFILYGGGKGIKHDNLFISKLWKLSQPHLIHWNDPAYPEISVTKIIKFHKSFIWSDKEVKVLKELGTSYLCFAEKESIIYLVDESGSEQSSKIKGLFRCGLIEEEDK